MVTYENERSDKGTTRGRSRAALWTAMFCCLAGCVNHRPASLDQGAGGRPADASGNGAANDKNPLVGIHEERDDQDRVVTRTEALQDPDGELLTDENGNLIPHGVVTTYWENGQKKSEVSYDHGVRHGPRTAWYADGTKRSYGEYVNGKANGTWTEWYADGTKAKEFQFDHGAWHGTHREWHTNGQLKTEVHFVRGKKQGPYMTWDESGQVVRRVEYVDDVAQP